MNPGDVSRTARLVAAARALETQRPGTRACEDLYAATLAGEEAMAQAAALPELITGIALRTRYLDEALAAFTARHPGGQIVLLGAGLDSRAFRLGLDADFFELDLPAMLAYKAEVIARERWHARSSRHTLPIDLAANEWAPALRAHPAFRKGAPLALVWEGVTYYLEEPAVHATLRQAREMLPRGDASLLVLDYVTRRWVTGRGHATSEIIGQIARWGEPVIWGHDDLAGLLGDFGMTVLEDLPTEDLTARWGLPAVEKRWFVCRMVTAIRS